MEKERKRLYLGIYQDERPGWVHAVRVSAQSKDEAMEKFSTYIDSMGGDTLALYPWIVAKVRGYNLHYMDLILRLVNIKVTI